MYETHSKGLSIWDTKVFYFCESCPRRINWNCKEICYEAKYQLVIQTESKEANFSIALSVKLLQYVDRLILIKCRSFHTAMGFWIRSAVFSSCQICFWFFVTDKLIKQLL